MVRLLAPLTPPPWPVPETGPGWAFFLDVDGTLLEYADRPVGVYVSPELAETIMRLAYASDGAVALISGRALSDVDRLFAPLVLPAAGQHGAERRRADGIYHRYPVLHDGLRRVAAELAGFTARHPGVLARGQGHRASPLHFRLRPELREAVELRWPGSPRRWARPGPVSRAGWSTRSGRAGETRAWPSRTSWPSRLSRAASPSSSATTLPTSTGSPW